jgi:hypothetical protein
MHPVLSRAGTLAKPKFSGRKCSSKKRFENIPVHTTIAFKHRKTINYYILVVIISLFAITLSFKIRCTLMIGQWHPHNSNAILGAILSIEREYWTLQIQMRSAQHATYSKCTYITTGQLHETNRPCNHYVHTAIETYYVCIPFSYTVGYFHRTNKSQKSFRNICMHSIFLCCRLFS